MTPEEKRIAIAEACGWRFAETGPRGKTWVPPQKQHIKYVTINGLPDYLNDLNAMHEAEKVLLVGTPKQIIHATNKYTNWLCRILGCLDTALFQFAHATAAQRADAFIATLDLDKSSHEPS